MQYSKKYRKLHGFTLIESMLGILVIGLVSGSIMLGITTVEKKIFNKSKGVLKLLDVGELSSPITIEISYASKQAMKKVEKIGGKVNLIKVL